MIAFEVRDIDGIMREIPFESVVDKDFRIFGMDVHTVLEMRKQYQLRYGVEPMSAESVKEVFSANV